MTLFFGGRRKAADRNSPLERTCSAALARASFISDFLTTMSASAARTRSSHTRWGNELLPLSLRIDFRTVPYAHGFGYRVLANSMFRPKWRGVN